MLLNVITHNDTDFIPAVWSRMLTQCLGRNQRPVSMAMTWTTFKDSFPLKTSHISFNLQVPSVFTRVSKIKCNQAHILFVVFCFCCFVLVLSPFQRLHAWTDPQKISFPVYSMRIFFFRQNIKKWRKVTNRNKTKKLSNLATTWKD